jgi:hypothetical protein
MTQKDLAIKYVEEFGSIIPAKLGGHFYLTGMFGSEVSRACRALVKEGKFLRHRQGRFEVFYKPNSPYHKEIVNKGVCCVSFGFFKVHAKDCSSQKILVNQLF